tara:strand:- start:1230 stop:1415 length:186 start_codon:yes stop_codon:yes gene_type:complete
MSCHSNEILKENILMGVLGMSERDMIDELGLEYVNSKGIFDYDDLIDEVVNKRFEEHPQAE